MAHTTAIVLTGGLPYRTVGAQKLVTADVTQSTTYATGGESVPASEFGVSVIEDAEATYVTTVATATGVEVIPIIASGGGSINLKALTAAAEVANGAGYINTVVRVRIRGK